MKVRYRRFISCLIVSAVASTALPQVAYAAPASGGDGDKGVVDTIKGWFTDDDSDDEAKPPTGGKLEIPSRQKLPKGKARPQAKRVKELKSKRTAAARYWQLSDGRIEAELSGAPESFKDGTQWKPIDTTLGKTSRRGFDFANTENLGRSYFGHSPQNMLRFEADSDHAVSLGLTGAKGKLKPHVTGDTVTYRDVASGADLVYEVKNGAVKENIVLAERPDGPVTFVFSLKTDGLRPKTLKNGAIALYKAGLQRPVMVIPAAFMTDASKVKSSPYGHAASTRVTQKLTRSGKDYRITVTPDAAWLASSARSYPVTIDPTITYAPPPCDDSNYVGCLSQGVMVDSSVPDTNYNGIGTAKTGNWQLGVGTTATGKRRSLVQFPLDGIPAGAKIDSARLGLYFDQAHTTGDQDVTVEAHRATGPWEQTTATWNKTSTLSGELSGTTVQVDDGDAGTTAAIGEWPRVGTIGSVNVGNDYTYNKNSLTGESYTWQPKVPEDASYKVEAHYAPLSDATTAAPYTVTYDNNGTPVTANYTVDQSAGSTPVWKQLGSSQLSFAKGTAGKIKLGDTGDANHRTVADAVRLVNPASIIKNAGEYNQWHNFPVTDTVQKWVSGTATNYGFVLQASDEATLGQGGPLYQASEYGYGGETATYPKLTITFGKVGTKLKAPTVLHDTGAELSWNAYDNGDPDTTGDDIVEYQIHRSVFQGFAPDASTLVAPVTSGSTAFTDTSAPVTQPDANGGGLGRAYYYQIAVKTKDGSLLGSPVQLVRLPLAGRTTEIIQTQSGITDTTLSSTESTTAHDTITDTSVAQPWLSVGNNHPTLGKTRALLDFPVSTNIPASATVISSNLDLWGTTTNPNGNGGTYQLRSLTRDFDESATWTKASAAGNWTTAGGDMGTAEASTVSNATNDPKRYRWDATSLTQNWIKTPSANKGVAIRLADESTTGPQERTTFLSSEALEAQLRPQLQVTYVDSTTPSTYSAQQTPARMTPNSTYTAAVTVTNTTSTTWTPTSHELSYRWSLADGTDATTGGNQVATALTATLLPGQSRTLQAQVKTPINSAEGNKRSDFVLTWDIRNKSTGQWQSAGTPAIPGLAQNIAVEDPTSNTLGLEKFYGYNGQNTGAGSTLMNNLASGNSVWSYNAFSNPGRGLNTFARFSYNSQDTSDTVSGFGWSMQLAGPIKLGAPLDFHPNPNPTEIRLPDGDGTTHVFTKQGDGTWKAPAGVHYKVTMKSGLDCTPNKDPIPDAWTLTRPDGTRFLFGCDGYMTSAIDDNGNTQTYTYEERKSNNKPTKFLKYITDPAGRSSLIVDYFEKGDATYTYVDDTGALVSGSNLTKSTIYDHVKSMTDISGRKIDFYYTDKGLLGRFVDGSGSAQPKTFKFTYDATQGNKNVKLVTATDPRLHNTKLAYYAPQTGDDPKYHWWTKTITDRLNNNTSFAYKANTLNTKFTDTSVTDAEAHTTDHVLDDFGREVSATNAKSQTTEMAWDADNNVTLLKEANSAQTTWTYDQKTGYPLTTKDAEANKNNTAATVYTYQTRLDGYSADLFTKTSPEGRKWQFGYDAFGNLKTVTDPKGVATTGTADDYTTKYDYDTYGELTKATDANGNPTNYSVFGPTGYPATITDALDQQTSFVYDERGQVSEVTDALGKKTTQTYDTFGRPLANTVPKDQAAGVLITTPAPVYDANDNVTKATAPNGASSTAVYDDADQIASATAPANNNTEPRSTIYTYDKVGNLKTTTEPKGVATTSDATDYVTTSNYDAIYQLTSAVNVRGDKVSYEYDTVGNLVTVIDPKKNATADTTDYTTKSEYDWSHRVTKVTDAAGKYTTTAYDKDDLVTATTDQERNQATFVYDERAQLIEKKTPYEGTTTRSTKIEYDQVGNQTKAITPRGVNTANAEDFTARTEYDRLNRPVKQYQPYDPADGIYNSPNIYTQTVYDELGRVKTVSAPPSEGQSVRNDTDYTYFDNGWAKTSTDPWDILTEYDYTDLGQQKSRTLTSAGGGTSRTMGWSYYPDGSMQARSDDGVPVGRDVVVADNSDSQSTSATGTWATGNLTGQQGYDHRTHASGTGTDAFTWKLNIPKDGIYTVYAKFPKATGAATAAKYTVTHDGTPTDKSVDQNANTGTWVSLGSYSFKQGNTDKIQLFQNSTGTVVADAIKLVRTPTETDNEKKNYSYSYDLNGNLTSINDSSSSTKIDSYTVSYTSLNQVDKVAEALGGQEKKATTFAYDANGQVETVTHPDQYSQYLYDLRELVKTVKVGKSAADTSPEVTQYAYTDRGQRLQETKANNNTVDYAYYLDGSLKAQTEKKPNGTLVASHSYAYDPNGNRAQDVAKKMNADDHTAYLSSTTDYTYDPADRLAKAIKTGNGAGTETYVHDNNANVISQTLKGTTTTYRYDRNRLLSSLSGSNGNSYNYDAFGRLDTVTSGSKILEDGDYDGFDRAIKHTKLQDDSTSKTATYTYDPLDRTTSKTVAGKTTDFSYLGLSSEVLSEAVAGEVNKSFQYSPWGERLSQIKRNGDGTEELGVYGYNSHSDTETLTDSAGDTKATYGYTAYGNNDDSEFTGIDKPDAAQPDKDAYNPYRFNAKRWDAASGTYDMGFRDYNPGLNRFATRDMYNGALDDMGLGADAYTGNRYAFGGGNPISMVELDGHTSCEATGMCGGVYRVTPEQLSAQREKLLNPSRVVQINKLDGDGSLKGKSKYEQNIITESQFNKATSVLGNMYDKLKMRLGWVNAQIAHFDVKHGDGTTSQRVAVFISGKGKLPKDVLGELTSAGIAVFQPSKTAGTKGEGHSEAVGAALRKGNTISKGFFGGTIGHVNTSISANPTCSIGCAKDQSIFTQVKIQRRDVGLLNDKVFSESDKIKLTNVTGSEISFLQVRQLRATGYDSKSMLYFANPEPVGEPE